MAISISDWIDGPINVQEQTFSIGDVHGMSNAFKEVLDAMATNSQDGNLILLGDFVDRGPDSLGSLDLALKSAEDLGFKSKTICQANHEAMMLMFFDYKDQGMYLTNGGNAVMRELGIDVSTLTHRSDRLAAKFALIDRIGEDGFAQLENAVSHKRAGNLLFVHAGIPSTCFSTYDDYFTNCKRYDVTNDNHYYWIRYDFFYHENAFETDTIVVHGHTPERIISNFKHKDIENVEHRLDGWRLGLDGHSFVTGKVIGVEFLPGKYRIYTGSQSMHKY